MVSSQEAENRETRATRTEPSVRVFCYVVFELVHNRPAEHWQNSQIRLTRYSLRQKVKCLKWHFGDLHEFAAPWNGDVLESLTGRLMCGRCFQKERMHI